MKFTSSAVLAAVAAASFRGALAYDDNEEGLTQMTLTKTIEWKQGETEASAILPQVKIVDRENARRLQAALVANKDDEEEEEQTTTTTTTTRHLRNGRASRSGSRSSSSSGGDELLLTAFFDTNSFSLLTGELLSFERLFESDGFGGFGGGGPGNSIPINDTPDQVNGGLPLLPACTSALCHGALSAIIEGEEDSADDCLYARALIPVLFENEFYSLNCPATAMDAEVKVLGCLAGTLDNGTDNGECPPAADQIEEYLDTAGYTEISLRVDDFNDSPVTYYVEFSCCPMEFPGLEMSSSSSKSGKSGSGSKSS